MKRPPSLPATVDLQRRVSLVRLSALWAAVSVPLMSCGGGDAPAPNIPPGPPAPPPGGGGGGGGNTPPPPPPPPPPAPRQVTRLNTAARLSSPWSFAFLPDGRIVFTQKAGTLVVMRADFGALSSPFAGVPTVNSDSQGGLLDIVLDPDYTTPGSNWVYFSYTEPDGAFLGTAVNRGRLDLTSNQLLDVSRDPLFRQFPKTGIPAHYGSRLAFRGDGTLFITLGEKQSSNLAQDLTTTLGKVVRINRDGSIPTNNPNMGAGARPGIWSTGHRNPQGAAIHPGTGELWVSEHGPQGGDEINIARAGQNYGWPVRSYGCNYGATNPDCMIGGGTHAPTYTEPVTWWPGPGNTPPYNSIAPSAMVFYSGARFTEWQGNLLVGAQADMALWRLTLSGNTVTARERIWQGERVRCVREGPDGWIYFITDDGWLYRMSR
jgi:glucose/arabinose dehydrogenase